MVSRSTTSARSSGPRKARLEEPPAEPSRIRSRVNLTAGASKGVPSWNFTPSRSLNVQVFPSGDVSQAVARSGRAAPPWSSWTRLSKMTLLICTPVAWIGPWGSSVVEAQPGIEYVPEPVSDHVDGDHRQHVGQTREDRHPRSVPQVLAARAQHRPPLGGRGPHAQPQEAQRSPGDDGPRGARGGE